MLIAVMPVFVAVGRGFFFFLGGLLFVFVTMGGGRFFFFFLWGWRMFLRGLLFRFLSLATASIQVLLGDGVAFGLFRLGSVAGWGLFLLEGGVDLGQALRVLWEVTVHALHAGELGQGVACFAQGLLGRSLERGEAI